MLRFPTTRWFVAALLVAGMVCQETWALAGTTGRLSGTITATTGGPIADARVTASSPSETTSTTTDASGNFVFLSLSPDTYSISVQKDGYQPASLAGIAVFADNTQTVAIHLVSALKQVGEVTSRAGSSLVKSGTTADVYSVSASMQDRVSGFGGGGGLNSAYSAIASVPGAYVPPNQMGYYQTVHIRGGDYDQVGYELDGVPVNRSFDNYPSGAASSLGQQELQVYTGASPATSEGQGLAGYINQVIRTGTYPGYGNASLALAAPVFYHKASIEAGGASPDRLFSYYVGVGGFDQQFRFIDQNNGISQTQYAGPLAPIAAGSANCPAITAPVGCYSSAPYAYSFNNGIADRDVVMNVHIGIPHKNNAGKDDIQLLWDSGYLNNSFEMSTNDAGGPAAFGGAANAPVFIDGYQWTCGGVGQTTTTLNSSCVSNYYYPNAPPHQFFGTIPYGLRDGTINAQEIVKLQYQKNFGSDAFLRIYGYTYYSDWSYFGPNSLFANYVACCPPDYNLFSHTRGASATFSKQFDRQNLVTAQASYTTATSVRDNNTQMLNSLGTRANGVVMVNANAPLSGYCFSAAGTEITCNPAGDVNGNLANFATWGGIQSGTVPALAANCNIPGGVAGPCTWLVAENSLYATYNSVTPKFTSASLTDEFRPNDKLLLNLGLRFDQYQFVRSAVQNDAARSFWFTAWNLDNCINSVGAPVDKSSLGLLPSAPCPAGYTTANLQNTSGTSTYDVLQPRLSGTYTFNPDSVLRFSAGKYVEPPNAAFEQYDGLQEDLPWGLPGTSQFYGLGFTSPGFHEIRPPTSLNFDVSLEQHLRGTDLSYKLTPFLRSTDNQIQQIYLDQKTGFSSGLNVGHQTSRGVELQLDKGDFNRNGFAGQLAFAYTYSTIHYDSLSNGSTVVTPINSTIAAYNAFTKAGGGSPCYVAGTAAACTAAGAVANPYYNAPLQPMISATQDFIPYTFFPGGPQSFAVQYGSPYVASLALNYKRDKFTITPLLQFAGGARYGEPETTTGINPATCGAPLAGFSSTGDPRYPYGSPGGGAFDATNCTGRIVIPDAYTGAFDGLGSFVQPAELSLNLQTTYTVSPRVTLVGTFTNIVNACMGGTPEAWTVSGICSYNILNNGGAFPAIGNVYNPPATLATFPRLLQYPYGAYYGVVNVNTAGGNNNQTIQPFNFYLEARLKL